MGPEKRGRKWVRIPYVWSPKRKALIYSCALHLALLGGAAHAIADPVTGPVGGDDATDPTPARNRRSLSDNPYASPRT